MPTALSNVHAQAVGLYRRAMAGSPAAVQEMHAVRARAVAGDPAALAMHQALRDAHASAQEQAQIHHEAADLYARLRAGDGHAQREYEKMQRNPRGRQIVGAMNQLAREASIFPQGPGAPRFGAQMPTAHRPGVGPGGSAPTSAPWSPAQQNRARFAVGGQKLSAGQIAELKAMMLLAAQGLGPDALGEGAHAAAPAAPGGSGIDDVLKQLAKARADATAMRAAEQRMFKDPTALNTIIRDPTVYHWDFAANAPMAQPAAPYTGPSMSDTGVGPNPTWDPGQVQPYAQGGLQSYGGGLNPDGSTWYGGSWNG